MRILDQRRSLSRQLSPRAMTVWIAAAVVVLPYVCAQDTTKPEPGSTKTESGPRRPPSAAHREPDAKEAPVDRPKVVSVQPSAGATGVNPETEIRVRFDRPMNPNRVQLEWGRGEMGFRTRGGVRYDTDTHEFVLPVWLTPGSRHEVTAGSTHPFPSRIAGFETTARVGAEPFTWSFTTANRAAKTGTPPRVLSVEPPSDSEVALLTPVKVTFDTRMDPNGYGVSDPGPRDLMRGGVTLLCPPDRGPGSHSFTLLLGLPANWNGEVVLSGFRSEEGVEAAPLTLRYRTLRRPLAGSLTKTRQASPEKASQVVKRAREARRKLTSGSVVVRTVIKSSLMLPDWDQRYDVRGARFRMQGERAFVGEVDTIMGVPFRVGSDGKNCWWRMPDGFVVAPFEAIEEKNLCFCDPFDARGTGAAAKVLRERSLVYKGEVLTGGGRHNHVLRSLETGDPVNYRPVIVHFWEVAADTHLLAKVETLIFDHRSSYSMEFTYTGLNQPIPEEEFRPPSGPGEPAARKELEPMKEGYTRRFLNVSDGSNGRMSARWGMKGPKGTMSSGLN